MPHRTGDRSDAQLREIGTLCAQRVDRLFIFEMQDRRGREHGETASLLEEGADASGATTRITVAANFDAAFRQAFDECEPGDLLLIGCADETHDLMRVASNAVPISPDSLPATGALRVAGRRSAASAPSAQIPTGEAPSRDVQRRPAG